MKKIINVTLILKMDNYFDTGKKKTKKMVDSRVRVQLGPSPVNHEKNTNRLNKWFRFI